MRTENSYKAAAIEHCNKKESTRDALRTVIALRKLTAETGTRTTRSQNEILRALSDEDLTALATALLDPEDYPCGDPVLWEQEKRAMEGDESDVIHI